MSTTITNYTTYDLASYYTDVKRLPRLSDEEEQHLISTLARAATQPVSAQHLSQAKQRLIEGHLGLAISIARDLRSPRRPYLFPDLVQAANLALVEATQRCDWSSGGHFTAYIAAWMRGRVKQTLGNDWLLKPDDTTRRQARQAGTLDELYTQPRPLSLDRLLDADDADSGLLDLLEAPSPAMPAAPVHDDGKRTQVDALLAYLSPRAQMVLRLRYGLLDGDERPRGEGEIARTLGISRSMVHTTEHDAMQRLQALAQGQATLTTRNGKGCISLPGCRTPTISPERMTLLSETCQRLQAEGRSLNARLLARETGVPEGVAAEFLRQQRGESADVTRRKEERQQGRLQRLEEEYARLAAEGKTPSGCVLARRAHVAKPTALAFLRARKEACDAAQAR
jgi:RNA polymerase sigma factor (sigma-70 family)